MVAGYKTEKLMILLGIDHPLHHGEVIAKMGTSAWLNAGKYAHKYGFIEKPFYDDCFLRRLIWISF